MPQIETTSRRYRRRLPLSLRIAVFLMLAALLPLGVTAGISAYTTSQALIAQANNTMQTDAKTRMQLIDTYLHERLLDAYTLSQVPTVWSFLQSPAVPVNQDLALHAGYALAAGKVRDSNYTTWALFDPHNNLRLYYSSIPPDPKPGPLPQPHGSALVPAKYAQLLTQTRGNPFMSDVYYNPSTQTASIDIYAPIYATTIPGKPYLGCMRATLKMDYIWGVVHDDRGLNGSGGSFILDENGVRIADSNDAQLFTTVAQFSNPAIQQEISAENSYGQSSAVPVQANDTLASIVTGKSNPNSFSVTLPSKNGTNQPYQAARATANTAGMAQMAQLAPWNYFVVSPNSEITSIAFQQLPITLIVAIVALFLASILGLLVAGGISRPIIRSATQLRENSEALNTLAKKQQSSASEQLWVVDSVQVGLQSVQYYTDATRIAAHKLGEVGNELEHGWQRQNVETIRQGLQHVISAANYIEKAAHFQGDSSQKLSTAIKVTTQVNEQLADSAISATEAASQLEQVVNDLRQVVGQ